jgi:hypothetical protein
MHQIKIVENPFNFTEPAWEDQSGRVGVRVDGENSVKWYNMVTDSGRSYLLDELTMIVDTPFNTDPEVVIIL